jgi:hypothetical protein
VVFAHSQKFLENLTVAGQGSQGRVKIFRDEAGGLCACAEIPRKLNSSWAGQPGPEQDLQGKRRWVLRMRRNSFEF